LLMEVAKLAKRTTATNWQSTVVCVFHMGVAQGAKSLVVPNQHKLGAYVKVMGVASGAKWMTAPSLHRAMVCAVFTGVERGAVSVDAVGWPRRLVVVSVLFMKVLQLVLGSIFPKNLCQLGHRGAHNLCQVVGRYCRWN